LIAAPAGWGATCGSTTCLTTSTAEIDTINTTNVTQRVDTYSVELKARLQNGAFLFDQTYNVAFTDPLVLAGIA
jgi:hypothetical protein